MLPPKARSKSLNIFRSLQVQVLIATDLVQRGLDLPNVSMVINLHIPRKYKDYVHRAGRTGRAGARGVCLSLVGEDEVDLILNIEKKGSLKMEQYIDD